ncbi:hypothetical protein IE81DRAFT_338976 [Ceraceosorus guamensis]|uniref:D-arabinono-1,4-lactone oxidase n=1 Tax=Ceraceosorus guamensis TaxID=1522189 RepID=A0A316W8H1_9BASI|nr:hypothetical protein IE81DRAFT_338976 [Ceraceosorus guamensis]PWN46169.1 hypothetical protein IE81DRAFT_338976 [Ceraceosorus guamensis]
MSVNDASSSSNASLVEEQRRIPLEAIHTQPIAHLHLIASSALSLRSPKELWNWGGTFRARPRLIFDPVNVEQCCALVELARREEREIRAVGRAHSPGDLMWTKDWVMRMKGLEGLVKIDQSVPSITVLGGTYVSAIHEMLAAADPPLAMSNVGSISEQTIGGLISTATHGTGVDMPPVSALIISMRIIVALPSDQGGVQVVRCSTTERPDLFNATLCGLGCTGLVVEAELKVEPAFCLRQVAEEMPFDFLFGPSTGAPSVIAQVSPAPFRPNASGRTSATPTAPTEVTAFPERLIDTPSRESLGHLLAQGRRIPTTRSKYLPSVRNEVTGTVWPIPSSSVDNVSRLDPPDEDDDEETRSAQRRIGTIVNSTQHAKIMYWPQARMCTLFRQDRTFEPPVQATLASRVYGRLIGHDLAQFLLFVSRYHRSLPPRVGKLVFNLTHPSPPLKHKSHPNAHGQAGFSSAGNLASAPPSLAPSTARKRSTPTTKLHTSPNLHSDGTPVGVSAEGRVSEEGEHVNGPSQQGPRRESEGESAGGAPAGVASVGRTTEEDASETSISSADDSSPHASAGNVIAAAELGARVGALRTAVKRGAVDRPGLPAHRVSLEDFLSGASTSATPSTFSPIISRSNVAPSFGQGAGRTTRNLGVHAPLSSDHATYTSVNTSHLVFNMDCLFPQYTTEWAIPFEHTAAAIRALRDWLEAEQANSDGERPHFPVEIRFGDADGIWLSPSQGRKTCFIGLIQFRPYNRPTRYRVLFERFEALMRYFAGRPHWAKSHTCGHAELRKLYPHLDDFLNLRRNVDPDGVFLNPYVRRHLLGEIGQHTNPRFFKARL